jgi:hypothetical protein
MRQPVVILTPLLLRVYVIGFMVFWVGALLSFSDRFAVRCSLGNRDGRLRRGFHVPDGHGEVAGR